MASRHRKETGSDNKTNTCRVKFQGAKINIERTVYALDLTEVRKIVRKNCMNFPIFKAVDSTVTNSLNRNNNKIHTFYLY